MTQYNSLSNSLLIKLSNSQVHKIKPAIKNKTEVILRLSLNMTGNSDNETAYPHKIIINK